MVYKLHHIFRSILLVSLILLVSCRKEKQEEFTVLESYTHVRSYQTWLTKSIIELLATEVPEALQLADEVKYDVDVYKLEYRTRFMGRSIKASGLIGIPASAGTYPWLSFQNGTNTEHSKAPSAETAEPVISVMQCMASCGYIVLIADYLGFGASAEMLHPYFHKESNNQSLIDLYLASDELIRAKFPHIGLNDSVFMMGYSQGGWSTLSLLQEMERAYHGHFIPIAASCGAGAYDLLQVARQIVAMETYPNPLFLAYFIESNRRNGFLDAPLGLYFNEPYPVKVSGLFNGKHSSSEINAALTDTIALLLQPNLLSGLDVDPVYADLKQQLTSNSVTSWKSGAKILFSHGRADKDVPLLESENIYQSFLEKGVDPIQINLIAYDTLNHSTAILPWGVQTVLWFNTLK